ncbi:MAG: AraC family transcriptional regulator [Leptospiraceae bacterium]|nr:AraC family transcriptional regulator [Leptospiraceae bacterium]
MKTVLKYLDFETKKDSTCGEVLVIKESSRDLGWIGVIVEIGNSPTFYPNNVCTPYFYFALDKGSGLNWKYNIDSTETDLHTLPGQIWINPPWVPFTHKIDEECHFIILAIEESLFYSLSEIKQNLQFLNSYNVEDQVLAYFIELFALEVSAKGKNGKRYLHYLLKSFIEYYIQNFSNLLDSENEPKSLFKESDLILIRKYISENFAEKISIEELSAEFNMSKFHFLREFKKTFKQTPYQFILNCKMEEAEKLLLNSKDSLTEIANTLGYYDQSHFTNSFRRWKGVSPKTFRSSNILQ